MNTRMYNTIQARQVEQPNIPAEKTEELPKHEIEMDVQTATGIEKVNKTVHAVNPDHAQSIGMELAEHYKRNFRNINAVYNIETEVVE